jgi:hypothetical protein
LHEEAQIHQSASYPEFNSRLSQGFTISDWLGMGLETTKELTKKWGKPPRRKK